MKLVRRVPAACYFEERSLNWWPFVAMVLPSGSVLVPAGVRRPVAIKVERVEKTNRVLKFEPIPRRCTMVFEHNQLE